MGSPNHAGGADPGYRDGATLNELFDASVLAYPENVALDGQDASLTYAELQQWAEDHHLRIENYDAPPPGLLHYLRDKLALVMTASNLRLHRDIKRFFDHIFEALQPDLVWVETPYLLRYALDWQGQVRVVVDYWGTSEGARRIFEYVRGWDKLKAGLHWQAARRGELHCAFDRCADIHGKTQIGVYQFLQACFRIVS